jgi:hypothetical protein
VAEAESLFEGGFEAAKRAGAPKSARPGAAKAPAAIAVEADDAEAALAVEPAGPAVPTPDGLRIPLRVRDASGRQRKLTLSIRFESEDS